MNNNLLILIGSKLRELYIKVIRFLMINKQTLILITIDFIHIMRGFRLLMS